MITSRRQEQANETRQALIDAGRSLFEEHGFAGVSAQEIVDRARVTRGALYHHFQGGKPGLLEAVARELQAELVAIMIEAAHSSTDPWLSLRAVLNAYFDFSQDKAYRQITLRDAPAVMGGERWRGIEHDYSLRFIQRGLEGMMEQGELQAVPGDVLAATIFGACCEASFTLANADNIDSARNDAVDVVMSLLGGLRR